MKVTRNGAEVQVTFTTFRDNFQLNAKSLVDDIIKMGLPESSAYLGYPVRRVRSK